LSVFLLTLGENLGFHCSYIASKYFISDWLKENFDLGVIPALDLSNKLIQLIDNDVWELIEMSGG